MRNFFVTSFIFLILSLNAVQASIVMTGTRVIFPAELKEKTVQLRNPDKQLYIVQVQVDDMGDIKNDGGSSAFIMTPQIFRMEPGTGQSVRLKYVGDNLPQDRETLFYLNFTQLPVVKKSERNVNQLILAVTSRVKLFYRPKGISGDPADIGKSLKFALNGKHIRVTNPTGYFAVIKKASLQIGGRNIVLVDSAVVAPKTDMEWVPSEPVSHLSGGRLHLVLVNDYGVDSEINITN